MELATVQMAKAAKARNNGFYVLDTTIKSGDKRFAPSWAIVMRYKDDGDEAAYTKVYVEMMRKSYQANTAAWLELLKQPKLALACYCRAGAFCHRILLADMLVKVGARHGVSVELVGEYR